MTRIRVHGADRDIDSNGEFAGWLDPTRTAVVSIDMHEGHLSEDPACPCPAPRGREIVSGIDAFHREARALGVRIIHVRSTLRASGVDDVDGSSSSAWRATFPQHVGPIPGAREHALEGSRWTQFVTEVLPGDEIVSGKKRLSAFYPTDLDFLLRQLGVTAVVLDGIMADCCVLNSAFDASNLGYRVSVPSDLVRGTDAGLEDAALSMISLHLGLVLDSSALLEIWRRAA
ncbi:cysteine hydrolase [Microbacterium sp. P26]|uniref:cysteine hydrolase family protein n=1 Tax=Microbacterium TaxID=33882 RepID=UPI0020407F9A|nr:isochorismatase family cysteine hydrolase [Microbacterium sp. P26]MCM3500288.1 cysteine hydrolase [Microbacterium sp. P26]